MKVLECITKEVDHDSENHRVKKDFFFNIEALWQCVGHLTIEFWREFLNRISYSC